MFVYYILENGICIVSSFPLIPVLMAPSETTLFSRSSFCSFRSSLAHQNISFRTPQGISVITINDTADIPYNDTHESPGSSTFPAAGAAISHDMPD
jgi:hypothetical protein